MKRGLIWISTMILALAVGVTACGDDNGDDDHNDTGDVGVDGDAGNDADDGGQQAGDVSIEANDQMLATTESMIVTVASAESDGPGWAVIHADDDGEPGEILGQSQLDDGENTDVSVQLSRDVEDGETLWAMLHEDAGEEGTFEGDEDEAVLDDNGEPVVDSFTVTLPRVEASAQTLDDLSTVVTIDSIAATDVESWLVIYSNTCADARDDFDGESIIGVARLEAGSEDNVEVTLDRPAQDDETLCAMLHIDQPADEEFTYPGETNGENNGQIEDAPATLVMSGENISGEFQVQVPEGLPAIRITFSADGSQDYVVDEVEPEAYDDGLSGNADPDITLFEGWRYEFVNTATDEHPMEFIAPDLLGESTVASQAEEGSGEDEEAIDWAEEGDSMFFDVAGSFADVEQYQSASAAETMSGSIIVNTAE